MAAPRWRRQSVKPPVEAPASRARRPRTSMREASRAASSFSPPRLTKRLAGPDHNRFGRVHQPGRPGGDGAADQHQARPRSVLRPGSCWPPAAGGPVRSRGAGAGSGLARRLLRRGRLLPGPLAVACRPHFLRPRSSWPGLSWRAWRRLLAPAGLSWPGDALRPSPRSAGATWPAPAGQPALQGRQIVLGGDAEQRQLGRDLLPDGGENLFRPLAAALDQFVQRPLGLLLGGVADLGEFLENSSARFRASSRKSAPAS